VTRSKTLLLTCIISLAAVPLHGLALAGAAPGSHSIYPPPVRARPGGALTYCPDATGLIAFGSAAQRTARSNAVDYGRVSMALDLKHSDRAWQPTVRATWTSSHGTPPAESGLLIRKTGSATHNPYKIIVQHSCGKPLVEHSLTVTVGPPTRPGQAECTACAKTLFFVDRRGVPLIYYVH
jgi:hypothetical protein